MTIYNVLFSCISLSNFFPFKFCFSTPNIIFKIISILLHFLFTLPWGWVGIYYFLSQRYLSNIYYYYILAWLHLNQHHLRVICLYLLVCFVLLFIHLQKILNCNISNAITLHSIYSTYNFSKYLSLPIDTDTYNIYLKGIICYIVSLINRSMYKSKRTTNFYYLKDRLKF